MWGAVAKGIGGAVIGEVAVALALNTSSFDKGVKQSTKNAEKQFSKSFNGIGNAGTQMFNKLAKAAAAFISIGALVKFSKQALQLGSDLQEVQNVVDVTFGSMSNAVNEYAQNAITSAGLSETVAKKYMGTFGAMSNQFGFTTEQSYEMARAITQLTGDVASFYNLSSDEAYTKLKSIWTGETETLKEIGVVMTQNALDQYALANGYGKTTAQMTEQEKVALRYAFVQEKLSLASGDFIRTQDSWANQTRVLTLRWQQFMATIGQGLINVLTPLVKMLNVLIGKLQVFANAFKKATSSIFGDANANAGGGTGAAITNMNDGLGNIGTTATDTADSVSKAAKKMKRSLGGMDELNVISNKDATSDIGSGAGISDQILASSGIGSGVVDSSALSGAEEKAEKITKSAYEWGVVIGEAINKGLSQIPWASIQEKVNLAMQTVAEFLNGSVDGLDWGLFGSTIGEGFNTILYGLNTFIEEFNWANLGQGIINGIDGFIASVDVGAIGKTLENVLSSAIDFMWGAVSNFDYKEAGSKAAELVDNIGLAIENVDWGKLGSFFQEGAHKVFGTLRTFVRETDWGELTKNVINALVDWLSSINIYQMFGDTLGLLWDVGIALVDGLWEGIKAAVVGVGEILYNILVKPIIDGVKNLFGIHSPSTVFAEIGGFLVDGLYNGLKGIWNSISSIFNNLKTNITTTFTNIWNGIKNVFNINNIKTHFNNAVSAIKNVFSSIPTWFKDTFTKAWTNVKNVFSTGGKIFDGIKDGIASVFKTVVNGLIGGINKVIAVPFNSINTMLNKIRDVSVAGIEPFKKLIKYNSLSVPQIPQLAQGGWLPANNPQLAIVGDNKREAEIVAPESKIYDQVAKAIKDTGGTGKQQLEITIYHKYEDGKTIIQKVNQAQIDAGEVLLLT